jgi:hypothetical protein
MVSGPKGIIGKPIGKRGCRQGLVVVVAIGQEQHAQPSRALWPRDFEPPDQGTRSTASIIVIIAARQLGHQAAIGDRMPVQGSGVGYLI